MIGLEDPRQGEPAYPSIVATSVRLLFDYNPYPHGGHYEYHSCLSVCLPGSDPF